MQRFNPDSQHFLEKKVKIGWHYIVSYMCYIAFIETVIFFPGLQRQLNIFGVAGDSRLSIANFR